MEIKEKEIFIESKQINLWAFLISCVTSVFFIFMIQTKWLAYYKQDLERLKNMILLFDNKFMNSILIVLIIILLFFVLIVIHEFIHGVFIALFSKKGWSSVRFGFDAKHLMPFASAREALYSFKMLIVVLAPFIVLGLFPFLYGFFYNDLFFLFVGYFMTLCAIGDFIYAYLIITKALNTIIKDHPSKVGFIIVD